jgi:hypothetical protein
VGTSVGPAAEWAVVGDAGRAVEEVAVASAVVPPAPDVDTSPAGEAWEDDDDGDRPVQPAPTATATATAAHADDRPGRDLGMAHVQAIDPTSRLGN